jgi:hypothetical protein
MGGYGSTRWGSHSKATTVEECRTIDVSRWVREGIIAPDVVRLGSWILTNSYSGERLASIGYHVDTTGQQAWARLFYTITPWGREPVDYDYKILLATTRPYYGGRRWWFVCPLIKGGRACYRRCGKLYLPPGGRHYGCRQCYELSYESAQEHDPRVSRLANDPMALYAAMRGSIDDAGGDTLGSVSNLLIALKASYLREKRYRR